MIGKLLGHTQIQTTVRYAHLASDPMKTAEAIVVVAACDAQIAALVITLHQTLPDQIATFSSGC